VTSRGNARQKIFFNDADGKLFLTTIAHVVSRYRVVVPCLLSDGESLSVAG
jgi:hypothetical protein